MRDREASTFFQRLQRDPLLILQILALLALSAGPGPAGGDGHGRGRAQGRGRARHLGVDEGARRRRPRASTPPAARRPRSCAGCGEGAEVMVLEAGVQPTVTAAMSRDRDRALAAIRPREPHDLPDRVSSRRCARPGRWSAAIRAPRSTSSPTAPSRCAPARDINDPRVRWVGVGRRGQQRGHHQSARSARATTASFDYQAFVSLVNYTRRGPDLHLLAGARRQAARREVGDAGAERAALGGAALQPQRRRRRDGAAAASATTSPRTTSAWAVLPPPRKIAVTLVSPGNLFLEKVLQDRPPGRAGREDARSVPGRHGRGRRRRAGLGDAAAGGPGPVHLRQHGAARRAASRCSAGSSGRPSWTGTARIRSCATSSSPRSPSRTPCASGRWRPGRPLVEAVGGPLIYALEEPDRKAIFVGFDLFKTDFPLRVAFPLILSNTLRWLHPAGARPVEPAARGRAADPAAGRRTASPRPPSPRPAGGP